MHTGKRRSLMPMYKEQLLGACELLHFPLVFMNRLNKTKSAVFLYCRLSLFLKTVCIQISLSPNKFNPYLRAFCKISSKLLHVYLGYDTKLHTCDVDRLKLKNSLVYCVHHRVQHCHFSENRVSTLMTAENCQI